MAVYKERRMMMVYKERRMMMRLYRGTVVPWYRGIGFLKHIKDFLLLPFNCLFL